MNSPNSKNEGSTDSTSMAFVSRPYNSDGAECRRSTQAPFFLVQMIRPTSSD